jgi:hypothetical protein
MVGHPEFVESDGFGVLRAGAEGFRAGSLPHHADDRADFQGELPLAPPLL